VTTSRLVEPANYLCTRRWSYL